MNDFHDVGDFHTKFGLTSVVDQGAYPRHPTRELLEFRLNFLLEELKEIVQGAGAVFHLKQFLDRAPELTIELPSADHWDHAQVFDGLIDLNYVSLGLAHIEGYPWREGWDLVQTANMAKERATDETASARGGTWDVIKPPGWKPPDIEGLLRDHGWGPQR
jgi:predicted HAD superfamily Cof-like phosphohydrolase